LLHVIAKELEEDSATDLLKWKLGALDQSKLENVPKKMTKEDALAAIVKMGFKDEAEEATKNFEKYSAPGFIDSVFVRSRLIKLLELIEKGDFEGLNKYLKLKIDLYNIVTIMRGIKNGADKKALEQLVIANGGGINSQQLREAIKSSDVQKALAYLESTGLPKVDTVRELEKAYEVKIARTLNRTFYSGYMEIGAIVGYLELKMREIRNIIRIANAISRGIDPKKISQEFIF
jgi:vacuolar-type H+-ATPase subunit C/Vma6